MLWKVLTYSTILAFFFDVINKCHLKRLNYKSSLDERLYLDALNTGDEMASISRRSVGHLINCYLQLKLEEHCQLMLILSTCSDDRRGYRQFWKAKQSEMDYRVAIYLDQWFVIPNNYYLK